MKKVSMKLVVVLFLSMIIFACGNTNDSSNENSDTEEVENDRDVIESDEDEIIEEESLNTIEDYAEFTTKDDLITVFGEENLFDGVEYYAEGTIVVESTTLTDPDNGQVIIYEWDDDFNLSAIKANYSIIDENWNEIGTQKVESETGLSTGMTLSDLRTWNGEDFSFSGFGWDFGGYIFEDEGSKITDSPFEISLTMLEMEGFEFATGDVELNADDERLKDAEIIVYQLLMYIN